MTLVLRKSGQDTSKHPRCRGHSLILSCRVCYRLCAGANSNCSSRNLVYGSRASFDYSHDCANQFFTFFKSKAVQGFLSNTTCPQVLQAEGSVLKYRALLVEISDYFSVKLLCVPSQPVGRLADLCVTIIPTGSIGHVSFFAFSVGRIILLREASSGESVGNLGDQRWG